MRDLQIGIVSRISGKQNNLDIDILIDKITASIEEVETSKSFSTEILPVTPLDLKNLLKKSGWRFNWKAEFKKNSRQLFKLVIHHEKLIQGVVSLQVMEGFIEMPLIEVAPHNFGSKKKYAGVAANLVAFACKMSFEFGFDGHLGFNAKTQLIDHYSKSLGAILVYKQRMIITKKSAEKLVNLYFKNYFDE